MDIFPFDSIFYGIGIGFIIGAVIYVREYFKRLKLKQEIKSLQKHLHQKLEIDAEATSGKIKEIEELKKKNENLRITNQTLMQKPGRSEITNFYVYQKAVNYMAEAAPGFAPLWQKALKEAEAEVAQIELGNKSFLKRIIPLPFSGPKNEEKND